MIEKNNTRIDNLERFQKLIDEYNSGSHNVEEIFQLLLDFTKDLQKEDQRAIREQLTEEELTIFDILTKPDMHLSTKEKNQVKKVAKELLGKLKEEKLVIAGAKNNKPAPASSSLSKKPWMNYPRHIQKISIKKNANKSTSTSTMHIMVKIRVFMQLNFNTILCECTKTNHKY